MKKLLITITCCLMILLYIPFNTFAIEYNGDLNNLGLTQFQINKLNELYESSIHQDDYLIYYSNYDQSLYWVYNNILYDSSSGKISFPTRFLIDSNGILQSYTDNTYYFNITWDSYKIIYFKYNGIDIFKNNNIVFPSNTDNYLLLSKSSENIVRSQSTSAVTSNRTRYYSYVDYDIRYTIKGYNFDVYYLIDNTYKLIQRNLNTFTIYNHESKSKFNDSSLNNDYPDYPTIPSNSITTYKSSFQLFDFYFVINNQIDLNTIIVKNPGTDSLLSDGNSNSQSATTNNNQSNQLLDNTVNQMESLENGFKNDLNSNLDNINANDFNISGITQLSNAANFVRVQFDNLTKNNPFGTILGFSLFLGLSLLIIGKRL